MPTPTRVLIVDDEPHIRAYVKLLVASTLTGVEIAEAGDEAAALAKFAEHRPDLVLLDINLIGGSGLAVLRAIRQQDQDCVIVMLTAINVRHTIEEAMQGGANGYIIKDAGDEEMADALREVLENRNQEEGV